MGTSLDTWCLEEVPQQGDVGKAEMQSSTISLQMTLAVSNVEQSSTISLQRTLAVPNGEQASTDSLQRTLAAGVPDSGYDSPRDWRSHTTSGYPISNETSAAGAVGLEPAGMVLNPMGWQSH